MMKVQRRWTLLFVLLSLSLRTAWAQVATTAVQDTVYRADGTPAAGSVVVSWNAFTTALGNSVPAGSISITIGADGSLIVNLAPNAGATPLGSYYTATFHLDDGSTDREYWVVPVVVAGGAAVKLSAIRNSVLPLSVAMQTVSKSYVDTAIARAVASSSSGSGSGTGTGTSGAAGGDLSGTYPNPAVSAVHATSGTLEGVVVGASNPAHGTFNGLASVSAVDDTVLVSNNASTNGYFGVFDVGGGAGILQFSYNRIPITGGLSNSLQSAAFFNVTGSSTGSSSIQFSVGLPGLPPSTTEMFSVTGHVFPVPVQSTVNGPGFQEVLYTPASSTAACTAGQFTDDANFHYVCVAAGTWKRAALSAF